MNPRLLLLFCLLPIVLSAAAPTFPGLKEVLTEAEWRRAGLDRLTPDQLGVIDAALIRHHRGTTGALQTELETAQKAVAASTAGPGDYRGRSWWERFGFANDRDQPSWRDQPPLRARVTGWQGANRFVLDNGQVWESTDAITYELSGREVSIEARPAGRYMLTLDGQSTTLHVRRVK
jgi:hypothetical protein